MIEASNVRETTTGVTGGVDVDVAVTLPSGERILGEVTLAKDHSGRWVGYGNEPSMWVSGALLKAMSGEHGEGLSDALGELETVAANAVEA